MKKRLISILLTLLMVMSLFTGMSVSAYADDDTDTLYVEYKLVEGDYVLRICQKLGINYYTCKEAIMALNNITSENGFRYLSIGEIVKIPVSDAAAIAIMSGNTSTGGNTSGSTSGGAVSGSNVSGATVAYYLIPYTMQRGETVLGVCNSLGISFANYADQIMKLNGISNWNKVNAGTTLLLPSPKTPAVGTTCYAVVAHKVASGDTVYTLSQKYGVNYGSSTKLLQALNNSDNLAAIKAGKTFYLPVATTITAANNNTGSSNTNTNTGSGADKNNTTTGSTNTNAKSYDINANINTNYGTMAFYVNNASVNSAKEGDVVTVNVTTKDGRAVESLVVKYNDGRADVKLEANSFIMPACDVRVDANIKTGNDITINSNYSFKTVAQVGGINVSSAASGSSVKIVSTDPGFEVKEVEAYYSTLLGLKKQILTVNDQNCFVMPNKDVIVNVTLAPVTTYNFYRADATPANSNGSFDIQVDGNSVSKAAKGAKVTVVWQAMSGYDISALTVSKYDAKTGTVGAPVSVYNNSFTMPASDILVNVEFGSTVNSIDLDAIEGGVLYAEVGGQRASEANTGEIVTIKATATESGYESTIKELVVTRKADGHRVTVTNNTFSMPAGGVIVSGKLESIKTNTVSVYFNDNGSENRVVLKADGVTKSVIDTDAVTPMTYAVGTKISLSTVARDSHAFTKYMVYVGANKVFDQEMTDIANEQGLLTMPNNNVIIEAYFSADEIAIGPAKVNGTGTVSYQVNKGNGFVAANSCKVGDTVKIIAKYPFSGAITTKDTIEVINKATGKALQLTDDLTFRMPAEGVSITVNFVGKEHTLSVKVVDVKLDTTGKNIDLGAESLMGVSVNDTETIVVNMAGGITLDVKSSDVLNFVQTTVGKRDYVIDHVMFEGASSGDPHEGGLKYDLGEFQVAMWDEDVTITIFMKEKTEKTISLNNVSWNTKRGSVGSTVGAYTNPVVSSAEVGDIVYIVPKALDPYFIDADSLTITRNFDDGQLTKGATNTADADMQYGKFYPVTEGTGSVVGWKYKMPEGGVTAHVDFKSTTYTANLNVFVNTDTAKANNLNGEGYVVLTATDTNSLYEVSDGKVQEIAYGAAVKLQLSTAAAENYSIESITIPGVSVSNNGFYMPADNVDIEVILKEKNPEPKTVKFTYTSNGLDNIYGNIYGTNYGKLEFYGDGSLTQLLNGEAEVGKVVYIKAFCNEGYQIKEISVKNKLDNTEIIETAGADYKFTMPAEGVAISVTFEAIEYKLTVACNANDNEKVQLKIGNSITSHIVKNGDVINVPYGTDLVFSIYDTDYTLKTVHSTVNSVTSAKDAYGLQATVKMPAGDMSVSFTLAAK